MASTSLTGIFAPGSPALVESLRTLVLDPKRSIAPGETVRVDFTFSNLGGAPATGVRVRFSHPQGVTHVHDGDLVDNVPLADGERFVDATGAGVGDLEPNSQRRVSCSFRVNDAIEAGTELVFQAALLTDQTALVGSNIERVVVRSRPDLRGSGTMVTISAPPEAKPGDTISVRAIVANTGSSSAHSVVVTMPAPENTAYVPHSARIDGRIIAGLEGEAFDYGNAVVASDRLGPGQSVTIEYQATIDSPLADGTRIKANGTVAAREVGEFSLASSEIVVTSPVDFASDETAFEVLCDDIVTPGMRVPMVLRIVNAGTGIADQVNVAFSLPRGLIYSPGSAHVDGQPVGDESIAGLQFALGALAAGRIAELGLAAIVAVPHDGDTALPVETVLRWKGGSRTFSRRLSVRVAPRFNRARNYVETDRGVTAAREDVQFRVHVYNDGTAAERHVSLRLIPGAYMENVRIAESDGEPVAYAEPVHLGVVEPHNERIFTIVATIGSRVPDRSNVALGVVLDHAEGAIDVGTATVVVRSHPQIDPASVAWELAGNEPLQPNRSAEIVVRFRNCGTDVLHDARLAVVLPPELAIERAVDARRDRDGLYFGEIPAETTHEARLTVRLLRAVAQNEALTLEGWLHGRGANPVQLAPLEIPTHAQPEFAASAQLVAAPPESVNAAERVHYEIRLRNDGDGPADRLLVRVVPTNLAVYVPSSTTINGHALTDESGTSQLWSQRGLVLADVNPGVDLRIRWEMVVMSPLAAGTALDTRAVLEWGDGETLAISAPTLRVQAQPTLSESTAGAPLSIARLLPEESAPQIIAPPPPPEPIEHVVPTIAPAAPPRAIAEVIARGTPLEAPTPAPTPRIETPRPAVPLGAPASPTPVLYLDFSPERLSNTIRMIERSEAGGLIQHLFAMRMLLPDNAIGASPQIGASFSSASRAMRAPLERFFVRLKMPRLTITAKDLEDRESRDAIRTLVASLGDAPPAPAWQLPSGVVRLAGSVDVAVVRNIVAQLETAPLGAATPWLVNAHLLGSTVQHDGASSESLGAYRGELLKVFTVLSELPIDEFHRVLISSANRTLDDSLAGVLDALRSAAHLAVE